jgi:hypothetical protein
MKHLSLYHQRFRPVKLTRSQAHTLLDSTIIRCDLRVCVKPNAHQPYVCIRDENQTCPQRHYQFQTNKQVYEHYVEEQVVIMEWTLILKT